MKWSAWMAGAVLLGMVARHSDAGPEWTYGLGLEMSYFSFNPSLPSGLVDHDTHPDDRVFLSGFAGSTDPDPVEVTLLGVHATAGRDRDERRTMRWVLDLVLWMPLSEDGREMTQNANDFRPPEQGSFIYTEIENIAPAVEFGIGASYRKRWSKGFESTVEPMLYAGYWSMEFDSGWNRFNADQTAVSSDAKGPSLAPQLHLAGGWSTLKAGLTLGYRYMYLDYDASGLEAEGAHGWDIGAFVTKDF